MSQLPKIRSNLEITVLSAAAVVLTAVLLNVAVMFVTFSTGQWQAAGLALGILNFIGILFYLVIFMAVSDALKADRKEIIAMHREAASAREREERRIQRELDLEQARIQLAMQDLKTKKE